MMKRILTTLLAFAVVLVSVGVMPVTDAYAEDDVTYIAWGSSELFGNESDYNNIENQMTKQADGTYTWTKQVSQEVGIVYVYVSPHGVIDMSKWNTGIIIGAGEVTITFDPTDGTVQLSGENVRAQEDYMSMNCMP